MIHKALAFIFRNDLKELLCFTHPITNYIEVVRGTVEQNENTEVTVIRELKEEAGILQSEIKEINFIGELELKVNSGFDGQGELENQTYFGYQISIYNESKPSWNHIVVSDGIDDGHKYLFEWKEINSAFLEQLNPYTRIYFLHFFASNSHC